MSQNLTIYGHPLSQPSRSVVIFCKLSNIPFEFKHIEILTARENFTEAYAKINPFQEVPAITHKNFNLWESAAIVSYLADSYLIDNDWYPKDYVKRSRINAYLHWHHQGVRNILEPYLRAKLVNPTFLGGPALTKAQEEPYVKKTENMLKILNWVLKNHNFIAMTEKPTIADIFLYSELANAMMIGIDLRPFEHVQKWFQVIKNIPIVREEHTQLYNVVESFQSSPKL